MYYHNQITSIFARSHLEWIDASFDATVGDSAHHCATLCPQIGKVKLAKLYEGQPWRFFRMTYWFCRWQSNFFVPTDKRYGGQSVFYFAYSTRPSLLFRLFGLPLFLYTGHFLSLAPRNEIYKNSPIHPDKHFCLPVNISSSCTAVTRY